MTEKIFLSYALQDKDIADDIEQHLKDEGVVSSDNFVIFDPQKSIRPGENLREVIREEISASSKVVIVTSVNSVQSQWVNYEAGMATALNKPIVLVSYERIDDPLSLSLGDVQFIQLKKANK